MKCYAGINTVDHGDNEDDCARSPLFVNLYVVFNIAYNILIILILKYVNFIDNNNNIQQQGKLTHP